VDQVLRVVWEAANYPWSVRLKALLPQWLPFLKKRLSISPRLESQLLRISPRQIDRRLKPYKVRAKRRLYGKTKRRHPASLTREERSLMWVPQAWVRATPAPTIMRDSSTKPEAMKPKAQQPNLWQ
jgi:hypothetical protein